MIIKLSWKFSILHPFSPAPPGSANLLMLERIGETLAGRAVYVTLWPFTRRERQGLGRTGTWSELLAATWWRVCRASGAQR